MPTVSKADEFANYAIVTVTESAANTLTFKKLETGISLSEKVAWIINRIEYFLSVINGTNFGAQDDAINFGLSVSNQFTTVTILQDTIIDFNYLHRIDLGAAASGFLHQQPSVKDLSNLPGGGLLVPPTPLYLFAKGEALASAVTVTARIHYTLLQLATDQYWQLVEARRVISS